MRANYRHSAFALNADRTDHLDDDGICICMCLACYDPGQLKLIPIEDQCVCALCQAPFHLHSNRPERTRS